MLKAIRIVAAIVSLVMVTLLFVDFTGTARQLWPWMAKIQFVPAVLSANALALLLLLALTLVFGRVYCSVICPLGILQDVVSWLRGRFSSKKNGVLRFKYVAEHRRARLIVLGVFVALLVLGLTQLLAAAIAGLIAPYSAYGRIASQIFAPVIYFCNNLLASWSASQPDNYTFAPVAYAVSVPVLSVAIITLVAISVLAWRGGRDYCNVICPVGTILGYLSKFSLLKVRIDTNKCVNCGLCGRSCKSKCIDVKAHAIDYSRCVACMDCLGRCKESALAYTWRRPSAQVADTTDKADKGRRSFMVTAGIVASALALDAVAKTDGGLTPLKPKQSPKRDVPLVPAGSVSVKHFSSHCTACQLCIQSCPSKVLKPSTDLAHFMQPMMDFTENYCDPLCTVCSGVCPVGAILPITKEEKTAIKIGNAVVDPSLCISATEGVKCGSCAAHCPAGAIMMIDDPAHPGNKRPAVNEEACIGCGSCEYHCPVGTIATMASPTAAINVYALPVHRLI